MVSIGSWHSDFVFCLEGMSAKPTLTVEYLEPEVEAEALPDEFSPSRLRRSLLILGAIVLVVVG